MRHVRLFEILALFVGQANIERGDRFRQVMGLGRTDNRRGDFRFVQVPRQRDLRGLDAAPLGKFDDAFRNREILVAIVEFVRVRIIVGARRFPFFVPRAIARQKTARERTPRRCDR
mgnify:CR=1 FL=1